MKHIYFLFLLSLSFSPVFSQTTATYNIVFTSVWNATDHGTLPGGAHWSKLVGANHNSNVTFLEMGQIATDGIEDVAEKGENGVFNSEVNTSIGNGNTEQYIDGNSLGSATGTITINNLEVDEAYPLLTLVSMIAPSPDWMIAINSIELRESGNWKNSITIDLFPYDAGTDNGTSYTASNSNTNPKENISSLVNVAPFGPNKIGTLTITLQSVLSTNNSAFDKQFKVFPNPTKGDITIVKSKSAQIHNVFLFNSQGRIIQEIKLKEQRSNNLPIKIVNLSSGLYFLKLDSMDGKSSTKKIIVE